MMRVWTSGLLVAFCATVICGQQSSAKSAPWAISKTCAVPIAVIAERAKLPHFSKRLRAKTAPLVLAIGSSSTWGVGSSSPAKTYPARLEIILNRLWPRKNTGVVNHGISGEIASTTAARLLKLAARLKPDVVFWQVGTNDAVTRIPVDAFRNTIITTIRKLQQANVDVVLVGLQHSTKWANDAHYKATREALQSIARQEKLLYIRRYQAMQFLRTKDKSIQLMAGDRFHLNDLGYQCMAEHIAHALASNLSASETPQNTASQP